MSNDRENIIRERRIVEATKKNYFGPSGKFGLILKCFGDPIIRQSMYEGNIFEAYQNEPVVSYWESTLSGQDGPLVYRDEILESDFEHVTEEGIHFDGLSRGMHLEMTYSYYDSTLKVMFEGLIVFKEVSGDLQIFTPNEKWESLVEKLYKAALEKQKMINENNKKHDEYLIKTNKKKFFDKIRRLWGV